MLASVCSKYRNPKLVMYTYVLVERTRLPFRQASVARERKLDVNLRRMLEQKPRLTELR